MIKLVFCLRKRADLSVIEFRKRWQDHQIFTRALAKAMRAIRITHSLTLVIEENEEMQLTRGTAEPFDGLIEVWWEDSSAINASLQDKQIHEMLMRTRADQNNLMDRSRSMVFFASEDSIDEFKS
jgi:hypothetical protein